MNLCLLALNANAQAGPNAGLSIEVDAALAFFIVRAGIGIRLTLLKTNLNAVATLKFDSFPLKFCFDLILDTQPLALDVYIFFQVRSSIYLSSSYVLK